MKNKSSLLDFFNVSFILEGKMFLIGKIWYDYCGFISKKSLRMDE